MYKKFNSLLSVSRLCLGLFLLTGHSLLIKNTVTAQNILFSQLTTTPSLAYSLRLLNSAYTGPLIEVRHGTNNATACVYPDASGNISASSSAVITSVGTSSYTLNATVVFSTFYKSATVFLVNWFDQSGNQRNLTQSNNSFQPRIVVSGTLQTKNLRTTLNFNSSAFLYVPVQAVWFNNSYSIGAVVSTPSSSPSQNYLLGAGRTSNILLFGWLESNSLILRQSYFGSSSLASYTTPSTAGEQAVWSLLKTSPGSSLNKNASSVGEDQLTPNQTLAIDSFMFIGRAPNISNTNYSMYNGAIQEIVIWPSVLTPADRYNTEANQCSFFGLAYAPAPVNSISVNINATNQNIDLTWTAPASNYSPITDYIIEYQQEGSNTWTTFADGVSTNTTTSIGILPDLSRYRFRVSAINSAGKAKPTVSAYITTPQTLTITYSSPYTLLGESITITITPLTSFTGSINITPSGGGLSAANAINESFNNDNTPHVYTLTPTTSSVVTITTQLTKNGQTRTEQKLFTIANPPASTYALDETGITPKGAYSLRQLSAAYKSPIVKVRFINNLEADITPDITGFVSVNSVATITATGSSSYLIGDQVLVSTLFTQQTTGFGYLVQWYDQSGNNKHLSAPTNNQPFIYLTNLLLPYPYITVGDASYLTGQALLDGNDKTFSINALYKIATNTSNARIFHQSDALFSSGGTAALCIKNNTQPGFVGQNNDVTYTSLMLSGTYLNIHTIRVNAPGSVCSANGALQTSSTLPDAGLNIGTAYSYIGRKPDATDNQAANIYELIVSGDYFTPSSCTALEKNQLSYYDANRSIYVADGPTALTASSTANNGEVRLSWNASVTYSTTSTVTGYQIEYKTTQSTTWTIYGNTALTYATISGLNASFTYQFRVKAVNIAGTGESSNIIQHSFIPQLSITGPICGYANNQSQNFTISTPQAFTGTVTVTPSGGGLSTPIVLNFTTGVTSQSFHITPTAQGNVTLTFSNTGGLGNPNPLLYTSLQSQTRLLNILTNANHAFSIRQLSSSYTGPCLTIRQETTNAEGAVYFDAAGEVSENSIVLVTKTGTSMYTVNQRMLLTDFISGQNIYVTTWYNQANTNTFNLEQSIAINQPLLASSGVLNRNNNVYIRFYAASKNYLLCSEGKPLLPTSAPVTINAVASTSSNATQRILNQSDPSAQDLGLCIKNGYLHFGGQNKDINYSGLPTVSDGKLNLLTLKVAPPLCTGSVNGEITDGSIGVSSFTIGNAYASVGRLGTTVNGSVYYNDYFDGGLSELIIYHSALGESLIAILESLQSQFYGITLSKIAEWKGSSNNAANNGANWSNQSVPGASVSVIIPSGTNNSPVISGSTLNVKNIYLYPGSNITVAATGGLNISGEITNNGSGINNNGTVTFNGTRTQTINGSLFPTCQHLSINNTAGVNINGALSLYGNLNITGGTLSAPNGLTLKSNAAGTAQISEISNGLLTGTVTAERYIPSIARRWRFVSSPVKDAKWSDWQAEIYITGTGGKTNGFDSTQQNSNSAYWYNETSAGSSNNGWTPITSTSNAIETGRGYRLFVRGDRTPARLNETLITQNEVTLNINGEINQGNIVMPITYTNNTGDQNDGWNLVGNPYPCAINWNSIHDENRSSSGGSYSGSTYQLIDPTIFVYAPASNSYKYYNALSDAGNLTGGIIGVGQAFFVKASGSGASLTLAERHKYTSSSSGLFKKAPANGFHLRLLYDSINYDETIFKFLPQASNTKDDYDVIKMYAPIGLGSLSAEGSELSVNCLPENLYYDTLVLSTTLKAIGAYEIRILPNPELTQYAPLLLFDRYTNTVSNLSDKAYHFFVNTDSLSASPHRFIVWADSLKTGLITPNEIEEKKITIWQDRDYLYITYLSNQHVKTIRFINPTGALVYTNQTPSTANSISIPINHLAKGIYVIEIEMNNGQCIREKLLLN